MKTLDYLDAAESRLGLTDYAISKHLDVSRNYISACRVGRTVLSDKTAVKLAKILDINPAKIIIAAHVERETDPEMQAVWSGVLEKISTGFKGFMSPRNPRHVRI